jgi:hypothetical protein
VLRVLLSVGWLVSYRLEVLLVLLSVGWLVTLWRCCWC